MHLLKGPLFVTSLLILATSCSSSRKTADTAKIPANTGQVACSNAGKTQTELSWVRVANPGATEAGGRALPVKFETFTIDNNQLKAFFAAAKQPGQVTIVSIPVPAPVGCQEFEVRASGAMSDELAAKYPDIGSLQGIGTENRAGDLRLDYDGMRLRGQLIWNGQIFLVTPLEYDKKLVYMIYDKMGGADKKEPFESSPANYRNGNNGNTAPSMQKYDR